MMRNVLILIILSLLLGACQPIGSNNGLSRAQRDLLRQEQFFPTDEGWELGLSNKILFATDEAIIRQESRSRLVRIGQLLQSIGSLPLRLDGHTDATGSDAYNEQLSLRRAQAVADILIEAGLRKDLLQVRGLGKRLPVLDNKTRQGRAENRRVAIVVMAH